MKFTRWCWQDSSWVAVQGEDRWVKISPWEERWNEGNLEGAHAPSPWPSPRGREKEAGVTDTLARPSPLAAESCA